jgi:hypothetical protein
MTHKLTHTPNYLLVVDDSEIKESDRYYLESISTKNMILKASEHITSSNCKKIIAHLPLNDSPILQGVDLLPPLEQEYVYEAESVFIGEIKNIKTPSKAYLEYLENGFVYGYNKAKEKFKYTEEDMRFIIMKSFLLGVDRAQYSKEREDEIIQSLSQSKMPTHFQVLYDIDTLLSEGKVYLMTTINSQGQTVLVGKYIY